MRNLLVKNMRVEPTAPSSTAMAYTMICGAASKTLASIYLAATPSSMKNAVAGHATSCSDPRLDATFHFTFATTSMCCTEFFCTATSTGICAASFKLTLVSSIVRLAVRTRTFSSFMASFHSTLYSSSMSTTKSRRPLSP